MSDAVAATTTRVSVIALTGMVVGSMVGGGVFELPQEFGAVAGVVAAALAWVVAGLGMLALALVFQNLALRRPDLDSGMYVYAQEGFGNYSGFNAAFGYWASNIAGNVFYMVLTMTTLGQFFPGLGEGDTVLAVVVASAGVWLFHVLITRGVREAVAINRIVTAAKLVPLALFVVIAVVSFDPGTFVDNLWGGERHDLAGIWDEMTQTLLVTTFVFLGVEGASVYSRLARRREDIGRATVGGFLTVLAIFSAVTMVSYGVLPRADLAATDQPSVGGVLASIVGDWGATFIAIGVVLSIQGAYLAWTLICAETTYMPARTGVMPRFLAKENANGTPIGALLLTTLAVQLLLAAVLVVSNALDFMLKLDTALSLIPYLFAAGYALKLGLSGSGYQAGEARGKDTVVALVALGYAVFLLYAAGVKYLLPAAVIYAIGTVLYVVARRERGERVFTRAELGACSVLLVTGVVGVVTITSGAVVL
ncbi:MAG: basic amino acid/polyamine antiporter [Nocardioidaceae bacterium]